MTALHAFAAFFMPHLLLAPIALPLLTAALMLLLGEDQQRLKIALNLFSTLLGLGVAVLLLLWVHHSGDPAPLGVYLPGNWPAPFGIVLVLDRLSAMMLVLTGGVALASIIFATAHWHRAGVHFHPLFQFQLMGLDGAFLTADLFNLFVFFEIMLAASYGLLLHGSGRQRVKAGLHYIAINLAASSLFLIGVSMLYGITGTLNMADLARSIPTVARGRPRAAACGRSHSGHRLPHQGGRLAPELLARSGLQRCHGAGGRPVRADDQGGCLHPAAPVDAAVWF